MHIFKNKYILIPWPFCTLIIDHLLEFDQLNFNRCYSAEGDGWLIPQDIVDKLWPKEFYE